MTDWAALYGKGTNPVCNAFEDPIEFPHCGCRRCGHPEGEHETTRWKP